MSQTLQNQMQQTLQQDSRFKYAQQMAEGKTTAELEQIARNLCKTRGIDFDEALKQFQLMWGK